MRTNMMKTLASKVALVTPGASVPMHTLEGQATETDQGESGHEQA
jgi:hypothetical protein